MDIPSHVHSQQESPSFTLICNPARDHDPIFWMSLSVGIKLNHEKLPVLPTSIVRDLQKPQFPFFPTPTCSERNHIRAHGWHGNKRGRQG